jgi:predicted cupin superfamily sugar epimerase
MNKAKYFIDKLELQKHPEGGWFKEVYRSGEIIPKNSLDKRFPADRNISTSILFLLEANEYSAFHRIKSDELWHYHTGKPLKLFSISPSGKLKISKLGLDIDNGEKPQIIIPQGHYFAAKSTGDFTLVGCTVAPGFDFMDFEMPLKKDLLMKYPEQEEIIRIYGH